MVKQTLSAPQKIAVIGSGIAGLSCAYYLSRHHQVSLFEAGHYLGGHTATHDIPWGGTTYAVDTGFIVYNDWTYPQFIKLLAQLGVKTQPTTMGFSVFDPQSGFEYAGNNPNSLFAQRRNLFKWRHWRMLWDIVRFNREATADYLGQRLDAAESLADYLQRHAYGEEFIHRYLIPMGAAIWSSSTTEVLQFSVYFFVQFFHNHGLLIIRNRPQWRVLCGGSRAYIEPLCAPFKERIFLNSPVQALRRDAEGVFLQVGDAHKNSSWLHYDQVVLACHSDQALRLLTDASEAELAVLGAIGYRTNQVILHTDTHLLPRSRAAWASWNYVLRPQREQIPLLTYNMNILQGLQAPVTFCVTLNDGGLINPDRILKRFEYAHPVFSPAALAAQGRWSEINGVQRTWFTGAYWFNGFHEDGLVSGQRVARALGVEID